MNEKAPTKETSSKIVVEIGSLVLIQLSDEPEGTADIFRIVSPNNLRTAGDEAESDNVPKLATNSALGSAILRKSIGDEVTYDTPGGGSLSVTILNIKSP